MDSISCPILWPRFLCEPLLRRGTPVSHAGSKTQCGLADRFRPQGPWRGRHPPELHGVRSTPGTSRIPRDRSQPHSEWTEEARVDQACPVPLVSGRAGACRHAQDTRRFHRVERAATCPTQEPSISSLSRVWLIAWTSAPWGAIRPPLCVAALVPCLRHNLQTGPVRPFSGVHHPASVAR